MRYTTGLLLIVENSIIKGVIHTLYPNNPASCSVQYSRLVREVRGKEEKRKRSVVVQREQSNVQ